MTRNRKATIGALVLAIAGTLAFSIQIAAAKTKEKPQGLWVGGEKYFSEFQGRALTKDGTPRANLAFGSSAYFAPESIAFDGQENFWAVFQGINDNLPSPALELTRADLAALKAGKLVKIKVLISRQGNSSVPFTDPESIGFDTAGDLWVIDGGQALLELTAAQIKKSGGPTPTISITSSNGVPTKLRFDGSDNLWVVALQLPFNPSSPMQLWRFAPGDRTSSGPANPSLIVNLPDSISPADFAFDGAGNIWLAGYAVGGDLVEMLSASDLGGTGEISPAANVSITSSAFGSSYDCLGGIDFDRSGGLWVSVGAGSCGNGAVPDQLVEFTPGQLSMGGDLTPSVTIGQNSGKTNLFIPGPLRFGPAVN
jgi:hypothetical protein